MVNFTKIQPHCPPCADAPRLASALRTLQELQQAGPASSAAVVFALAATPAAMEKLLLAVRLQCDFLRIANGLDQESGETEDS